MGRDTLSRAWTEDEITLADAIVDAVALGAGRLVGTLSIVRAVGLPLTQRSRQRVIDLMPLAAMRTPATHPGHVLMVDQRDHVYRITDDTDLVLRRGQLLARAKKARTVVERLRAEVPEHDTSLRATVMRNQIAAALIAFAPEVWDAIIADAEADAGDTLAP